VKRPRKQSVAVACRRVTNLIFCSPVLYRYLRYCTSTRITNCERWPSCDTCVCAVVTAASVRCRVGQPITLRVQSGYLSSSITTDSGRGAADCPWRLTVAAGQRINLTLINFARVSLPTDWSHTPGPTPPPADAAARPRPKICYQLANLRERRYTRVLTECEGSPRRSHAFLSSSNVMEVDIIVAKVLKVHFLLHFQGNHQTVRSCEQKSIRL